MELCVGEGMEKTLTGWLHIKTAKQMKKVNKEIKGIFVFERNRQLYKHTDQQDRVGLIVTTATIIETKIHFREWR